MAKPRIAKKLLIEEVERIAFRLAQEHLAFDEPIPDFSTRFPGVLESCISVPFQKFFGYIPYSSLAAQGSILFYLIIKNHPFQNGNKRIAVTVLLVFLLKNERWLNAELVKFHKLTDWVARSKTKDWELYLMAIESFIRRYWTTDIPKMVQSS